MKKQQPFDITAVQRDLEATIMEMPPIDYAQPRIRNKVIDNEPHTEPPLVDYAGLEVPAYLPQTENVSAITVASQYDEAARQVEAMGEALKEAARRAEAMAARVNDAIKFVSETAEAYRTEAALIFERIEKVDKLSNAVIEACEELKQRIKE